MWQIDETVQLERVVEGTDVRGGYGQGGQDCGVTGPLAGQTSFPDDGKELLGILG
jgi:hypothetical protein